MNKFFLSVSLILCISFISYSQSETSKIEILLLGTYHFSNPGLDKFNMEVENYMGEKRQAQIEELNQKLLKFEPNKVYVERRPEYQNQLDSLYNLFKEENKKLSDLSKRPENEIYQIGFKLAKQRDINKIHCIDAPGVWLGQYADFLADTFELDFYKEYEKEGMAIMKSMNKRFNENTVLDNLIFMNQWENIMKNQYYYNNIAIKIKDTVGIMFSKQEVEQEIDGLPYSLRSWDFENIGVELVSEWYKRNLLIYRNILENAKAGDRIILIFGQGHIRYLHQMLSDNPDFEVIDPLEYLKN